MRSNQLSYAPLTDRPKFTMRQASGQASAALWRFCVYLLLITLLSACQLRKLVLPVSPTPPPAPTAAAQGWRELAPGLQLHNALSTGVLFGQMIALRIDPQRYRLRAHYEPGQALTLEGWLEALPGVVAFINANFFSSNLQVNGLLVADGIAHGQPWLTRGGTLLVRDGLPLLRPSREQPWLASAPQQAVQGFPMLVLDGNLALPIWPTAGAVLSPAAAWSRWTAAAMCCCWPRRCLESRLKIWPPGWPLPTWASSTR